MDWGNDYFTFSDTNIEYIWRFLKIVHERGWLYIGHRSTEWCPRCGTSLSQHELTQSGVYQERADPSLFVRFPLLDRPGEAVVDLDDDAVDAAGERRRRRQPRGRVRAARERRVGRRRALPGRDASSERVQGRGARRLALPRAVRRPRRRARRSSTASIPWDEVSLDEGTGIVHIAPGCGGEDFELGKALRPAGADAGRRGRAASTTTTAGCTASRPSRPRTRSSATSARRGLLVEAGPYEHRYPHCWRCDTPLIFRIADDWFIAVDDVRAAAARGERDRRVDAGVHGQAHGRLAAQHGRLEHLAPPLLRPAAAVLPLRAAGT